MPPSQRAEWNLLWFMPFMDLANGRQGESAAVDRAITFSVAQLYAQESSLATERTVLALGVCCDATPSVLIIRNLSSP